MGRILGLDIGERRIGVAISDPDRRLAVPLSIVDRNDGDAVDAICEIARREQVEALVVGQPRSLSGATGEQAMRTEAFARRIAEKCGLSYELQDERLTSVQAERSVAAPGRGRSRRTKRPRTPKRLDDQAAAIILQSYLDRVRISRSAESV